MHEQELFDTMVTHLRAQGVKASYQADDGTTMCLYRAEGGRKCAVGCLIADEHYEEFMENTTPNATPVMNALESSLGYKLTDHELEFLEEMQTVHDAHDVNAWELCFDRIANEFGLNLAPE